MTNHEILNCYKLHNTLKRKGVALNEVNRTSLSELEKHQMIMELKAYICRATGVEDPKVTQNI